MYLALIFVMVKVSFSYLKKKFPKKAGKFVLDQEIAVLFLNSPVRKNWMRFIGLKDSEMKKIQEVVEHYAKLKVDMENKKKPKTKKGVIKIEDACLEKVFLGQFLRMKNVKDRLDAVKAAKKLLRKEYPGSVILDIHKLEKLAVLTGAGGEEQFPTDFMIFDPKNKKIISVEVKI